MWYFSWILGISMACMFSVINALIFEFRNIDDNETNKE